MANAEEVRAAMSEPKDIRKATPLQKAFVVLRAVLYFCAWVGLLISLASWAEWTPKTLKAMNINAKDGGTPAHHVCIFTDQFINNIQHYDTQVEPKTSTADIDECNFFLWSCIVGLVYAFIFFIITLCLLRNKRVSFKWLEMLERGLAGLFFLSCLVSGALTTSGIKKQCTYYMDQCNKNWECKHHRSAPTCVATVHYEYSQSDVDAFKDLANQMKFLMMLRDGVWAACVTFFLMFVIFIVRHLNRGSRQSGGPYHAINGVTEDDDDEMLHDVPTGGFKSVAAESSPKPAVPSYGATTSPKAGDREDQLPEWADHAGQPDAPSPGVNAFLAGEGGNPFAK